MGYRGNFFAIDFIFTAISQLFFKLFVFDVDLVTLLEKIRFVTFETGSKWRLSAGARNARARLNATFKFDNFFTRIILKSF